MPLSTSRNAATDVSRRRRDRPAWVPALAAVVTIALCVTAGNWQHRRMIEKQALQRQLDLAMTIAPVDLPAGAPDWSAWRYRQVELAGEYDARHQILIDNKVHDGRAGYDVVTPLRLGDGRAVLVDRGWIIAGASRAAPPDPAPPAGPRIVRGRIDVPPANYFELGDARAPVGPVWQHLDPTRFAQATGVAVAPIVVDALDAAGGGDLVRDWPLPDAGIEKHVGYMVQWYTFAAMAAGLWLWFTFRRRGGAAPS